MNDDQDTKGDQPPPGGFSSDSSSVVSVEGDQPPPGESDTFGFQETDTETAVIGEKGDQPPPG